MENNNEKLRAIPAVERILQHAILRTEVAGGTLPRALLTDSNVPNPLRLPRLPSSNRGRVGIRRPRWNDDGDLQRRPRRYKLFEHCA